MINQNLVTSKELSQRLKELGCRQESEFYWMKGQDKLVPKPEFGFQEMIESKENLLCSAFLSGELGEILPANVRYGKQGEGLGKSYMCGRKNMLFDDDFLAEAMGLMLEFLKENKLI